MKKALSLILVLVMAAGLLAFPALADGENSQSPLKVASVTALGKNLESSAVKPNTTITVAFDSGMDNYSDESAGKIYIEENVVAATKFEGATGNNRTFTVSFRDLPAGRYTLVIGQDVKSNTGATLGKDLKVTFFVIDGSGEDFGEPCPSENFADVDRSKDSWYHTAVDWAVSNGITKGTSDTAFSPAKACTRAEAVTFLYRAAGSPSVDGLKNTFTDVKEGSFYYNAVLWAVDKGITKGVSDTTFDPNATCTRAHIVTFLFRFAGEPTLADAELTYVDVPAGVWYTVPVIWADSARITNGVDETHFAPMSECTRAQIVTFLYRSV